MQCNWIGQNKKLINVRLYLKVIAQQTKDNRLRRFRLVGKRNNERGEIRFEKNWGRSKPKSKWMEFFQKGF